MVPKQVLGVSPPAALARMCRTLEGRNGSAHHKTVDRHGTRLAAGAGRATTGGGLEFSNK